MNIYDVSEKAGVSIATVSRVLNGNTNVSDKTRDKVLGVIKELGYTPNVFARGLGLNTMKTIGIMCSDSSDIYMANAIFYLERELRNHGYDSILCCTGYGKENRSKYIDLLMSKRVDAIILIGSKYVELDDDNDVLINAAKEIPLMLVNGYIETDNIYSVSCDDYKGTYDSVSYLKKTGHKNIVYLYTSTSQSGVHKMQGYIDACKACGLPVDEKLMIHTPKDIISAKEALMKAHEDGIKFDGVIASSDSLAVGAVKYAHELAISIPDKLGIIGYNNSILSLTTDPEITSVDSHVEQLSLHAISKLMKVLDGEQVDSQEIISPTLTERETT